MRASNSSVHYSEEHLHGVLNSSADALPGNRMQHFFLNPQVGLPSICDNTARAEGTGPQQGAQLNISKLDVAVEQLLESNIIPSTCKAYKSAQHRYIFSTKNNAYPPFSLREGVVT